MTYESWKIQIHQVLLIDRDCFPAQFYRLSYITSQLSGKAWEAVKDGVERMNTYPNEPEKWHWKTTVELWQFLDKRYILLDTTQTAKNALDTLFQEKRSFGDFKADFDHLVERAKYDDRTKVDLLRKRLNRRITSVIDNQVNLPAVDDYTGWSDMVNNIARNIQQQEHIVKLQTPSYPTRQNELPVNQSSPDVSPSDAGDPMDLGRIKLSSAERKFRMENGLCIACGQTGHAAKDHHRKFNPLPMPKRPATSWPPREGQNYHQPATLAPNFPYNKNSTIKPQSLPMPMIYYPPMQYLPQFHSQLPYSFPQTPQPPHSQAPTHSRLRAIDDNHEFEGNYQSENSVNIKQTYENTEQLKDQPLV